MGASATGLINPAFALGGRALSFTQEPVRELKHARELCEVRRFREALGVLNRVVLKDSGQAEAWTLMTQAHLGRGENAEALSAARRAGELSNDSEPHRLASIALVAMERFDEAADQAAEAVRRDPRNWRNFVEQARALVQIPERLSEARAAAQTAVSLAPHKVTPHLVAGQVELAGGEIESAARAFRQVFTIDPANPNAYNELARLHLHGGGAKDGGLRLPRLRGRRHR